MKLTKRIPSVLFALALLAEPASAQSVIGPWIIEHERLVNTWTTSDQYAPAAAATADGGFVVVWQSIDQWVGWDVVGRWFSPGTGFPAFRINSYMTSRQDQPAIAADGSGNFVVVWSSGSHQDGSGYGVFGQRFRVPYPHPPQGGEFQVNVYATANQRSPVVAADPSGAFIVVWEGGGPGDSVGIFARRYGSSGLPQGNEFRVNGWTTGNQLGPSVAVAASGEFVVTWQSAGQDGSDFGVFARRFSAGGAPQGLEFLVNSTTTSAQSRPAVSMDARGNFVIVWDDLFGVSGGTGVDVFGRAYDRFGGPLGPEFRVNAFTTLHQWDAAVALGASGDFFVTWTSSQDGSGYGVFGRYFEDFGSAPGAEFRVNAYTTSEQDSPAVASHPGGKFLTAWRSLGQDGSLSGVFQSRWATDLVFQDGFEDHYLYGGSPWSALATDGGDLSVSPWAALNGTTNGLQAVVDDTAGLWVQDDSPLDEEYYRARFYFDTNGFDPGEAQLHRRIRLFVAFEEDPVLRLVAVVLRRLGGAYALMARVHLDGGSRADTGFFPISDGVHFVELSWERAYRPDANDGAFSLWIDGTLAASLSGLDNDDSEVDFARLGALSVKPGAYGTLYLDEFESRRFQNIGP